MHWDFIAPWWLLLLPLAALPLLRRRADTLVIPFVGWLPRDGLGRALGIAWRALAVAAIACTTLGLAGPGQSGARVLRSGHGAELLILLDRSSSMDSVVHLNGIDDGRFSQRESKSEIVRGLLSRFVAGRPDDRFAFMAFGSQALPIVPFTEHRGIIQAALAAAGIGRGLPDTRMGHGLLAALAAFEGRPYSGSRVILVVSDGGARLDDTMQARIADGLARAKVALYWLYIRSGPNAPDLLARTRSAYGSGEEQALHDFFGRLATPYRLYQADDADAIAAAMAEIERQQNLPLSFHERVPRRDFAGAFFVAALLCGAGLLACRALQLRRWP